MGNIKMSKRLLAVVMTTVVAFGCLGTAYAAPITGVIESKETLTDPYLDLFKDGKNLGSEPMGAHSADIVPINTDPTSPVYNAACAQLTNRNGGLIFYFNKNEKVTNENYKNVSLTFDVKIINRKYAQMYFLGFWNQAWEGEKVENTINIQDTDEWQTVTTCLGDFENKQNFGFKDLRGIKIAPYCDWDFGNPISTYPTMWIKNVRLTLSDKKELTGTLGTYMSGTFTPVTELIGGQKIQSRLHYTNGLGEKRDLTIVTAVYKDDVLVDLRAYKSPSPAASGDKNLWHSVPVTLPTDVTGYKVTTMLWDNLENMNALLDCETVSAAPVQ